MTTIITTELVKELRDATGISVMQCKHALEEAEGDTKKAFAILKKTSSDIALKKADRQVRDGAVMIKTENNRSALVALLCETDFVSRNEDFVSLLSRLTDLALEKMSAKGGPASGWKEDAKDMIDPVIQKTGENIQLGDAYLVEGNILGNYVHNNKSAAIVSLDGGNQELAKDVAMQVVAMQPEDEKTLLDQPFIKNPDETIGGLLEKSKAKIKEIKYCSI